MEKLGLSKSLFIHSHSSYDQGQVLSEEYKIYIFDYVRLREVYYPYVSDFKRSVHRLCS